jgi:hypoxia up-regulated 1
MKEVDDLVKNQIAERAVYVTKSAEAASSSSASPSASPSVDPLDELEEEDTESAPSASAAPELEEVPEIYTEADRTKIFSVTDKAKKWLDETRAKQDKLAAHEEPVLTVEQLKAYKKELDDVVMEMMMKKMKHFKPPKPKASPKPKAKKTAKAKKSQTGKPAETPVAPKEGEAETEAPDAQAQAGQQKEDIKNNGPNVESHGGRAPTEKELREALKKAGVEYDEAMLKDYAGQEKHDEL